MTSRSPPHGTEHGRWCAQSSSKVSLAPQLTCRSSSSQAIADALVISIGTVKSHVNHILGKLEADNRTAAVSRARALGLLSA